MILLTKLLQALYIITVLNEAFKSITTIYRPSDAQPLPVQPLNCADVQIFRHES